MRAAIPRQHGRGRRQGVCVAHRGTVPGRPGPHTNQARKRAVHVPGVGDRILPVVRATIVPAHGRGTGPTRHSEPTRHPHDDGGRLHRAPAREQARLRQQAAGCLAWQNHTRASTTTGGVGQSGAKGSPSKFRKTIAAPPHPAFAITFHRCRAHAEFRIHLCCQGRHKGSSAA